MWSQREINEYIVFADRSFEISKVPNLIKNHLLKFKKQLSERATVPNSHPWYQLMQPQTGFIDDFENKIKIVWRDISIDSNVTIINQGVYPDMTCYYIPINDKALCAWMYSDFFVKYLFRKN